MAKDFFGYSKEAKGPGNIVSPTMVIVSIDGTKLRLAQSVDLNYSRTVEPTYELGSDSVWMVAGKTSGSCTIQRAIGTAGDSGGGGLLVPFVPKDACKTQTLIIAKGDGACGMDPGTIVCGGCLIQSIGANVNVGALVLTDTATYNVGSVSLS
jgi:hypothetical protein